MAGALPGSPTFGRKTLRWPYALLGLFFIAGLGMLGGAGYLIVDTRRDIAAGTRADGIVIDLIVERDSDGDDMSYPRVRFMTAAGESVEFTGSVGSRPAAFDIGEAVAVLYDPAKPRDARIDSFFQLWFGPLVLGFLGVVFTAVGGGAIIAFARPSNRPSVPVPASPATQPLGARHASAVERAPRD
jgi:Protein of unknown function (DUF3592)